MIQRYNQNSLDLCRHLEALAAHEDDGMDLGIAKIQARNKTGAKKGFFDGLAEFFRGATKSTLAVTRAAGGPRPLAREIETLYQMKTALRQLSKTSEEIRHRAVPRLYARKNAESDLLAQRLTATAKQAEAHGYAVTRAIDAAINAALSSQKSIEDGKPMSRALAGYLLRRKQADEQFNAARLRLSGVHSSWQAAERQLVAHEPTAVRETGRIIRETVTQFTQTAARGAQDIGGGLLSATPALKYLPHIALAGAALFIITSMPRRAS